MHGGVGLWSAIRGSGSDTDGGLWSAICGSGSDADGGLWSAICGSGSDTDGGLWSAIKQVYDDDEDEDAAGNDVTAMMRTKMLPVMITDGCMMCVLRFVVSPFFSMVS